MGHAPSPLHSWQHAGRDARDADDPALSPTANTLMALSARSDPHEGQTTRSVVCIERSSFSNRAPHLAQTYS